MKVLFLTNIPSKYRVDFFNLLGKSCELTVLFERCNLKFRDESFVVNNFINFSGIYLNAFSLGNDNTISFKVKKYIKHGNYDLIILGNYHTFTSVITANWLIKHKIPYGLSIDGMFIQQNENKIKHQIKKRIFSNASWFVTTGAYSVNTIKYYGGKEENCYLYPFSSIKNQNILDDIVSKDLKRKIRHRYNLKEDSKVYLYIGQMIERKGIDTLLLGFPNDNKYQLLLIGGKLNKQYEEIIKRRKLSNVVSLPFIQFNNLKDYYMLSDFFVLPTNEDAWALVINEALAYSLPIISTNKALGALELIMNQHTGYVIENNNPEVLEHTIVKSSKLSIDEYIFMQKSCLNLAKKYTIEKMVEMHLRIFKEVKNIANNEKNL